MYTRHTGQASWAVGIGAFYAEGNPPKGIKTISKGISLCKLIPLLIGVIG